MVTKQELLIDKNELDRELIEQASQYHASGEEYAKAQSRVAYLKDQLSALQASIDREIRQQASEDNEKVSETLVFNRVVMDDRYRAMNMEVLQAREAMESAGSLRDSFAQRAFALKDLVVLYTSGYFARSCEKGVPQATQDAMVDDYRKGINATRVRLNMAMPQKGR